MIINQMVDPRNVLMSSTIFTFDGSSKWRLELPRQILGVATSSKTIPLRFCICLTPSGYEALGVSNMRMDVRACLIDAPGMPPGSTDGTVSNYTWKTVGRLHPTQCLVSFISVDWVPPELPYAVVVMIEAVSADSPAEPVQNMLEDIAVAGAPAPFGAPAPGFGQSGAVQSGSAQTHIANLPLSLVGAFIGAGGANVKALGAKYGNCKIAVQKESGRVMVSGCSDIDRLHAEVMAFMKAAVDGGGGGRGGGGGGGGGPSRSRGGRRNGK